MNCLVICMICLFIFPQRDSQLSLYLISKSYSWLILSFRKMPLVCSNTCFVFLFHSALLTQFKMWLVLFFLHLVNRRAGLSLHISAKRYKGGDFSSLMTLDPRMESSTLYCHLYVFLTQFSSCTVINRKFKWVWLITKHLQNSWYFHQPQLYFAFCTN